MGIGNLNYIFMILIFAQENITLTTLNLPKRVFICVKLKNNSFS